MKSKISDLKTEGVVSLDYPADLRTAVKQAEVLWRDFCARPEVVKKGLTYSNNSDGVGYELKLGEGHKADRKENFDLTQASAAWLQQHAAELSHSAALPFLQQATSLVGVMKPLILDF